MAPRTHFALADLRLPPAWLSFARIPLAACFAWLVDKPTAALTILALAGLSDVLDGWVARRYRLVTATGAVLDPITDKIFVLTVAVALVASGHLSFGAILLLSTREIGELPLVIWLALSHSARAARIDQASANRPGKVATVLQFVTVGWALFRGPHLNVWLLISAAAGVFAALTYWRRALRTKGARPGDATA
ncbi:MAG: CDP-alcohol phosphatidyltransferase family protein [Polyangiaceae bacterium]